MTESDTTISKLHGDRKHGQFEWYSKGTTTATTNIKTDFTHESVGGTWDTSSVPQQPTTQPSQQPTGVFLNLSDPLLSLLSHISRVLSLYSLFLFYFMDLRLICVRVVVTALLSH